MQLVGWQAMVAEPLRDPPAAGLTVQAAPRSEGASLRPDGPSVGIKCRLAPDPGLTGFFVIFALLIIRFVNAFTERPHKLRKPGLAGLCRGSAPWLWRRESLSPSL